MIDIGRYCVEREIHTVSSFCVCLKLSMKNQKDVKSIIYRWCVVK